LAVGRGNGAIPPVQGEGVDFLAEWVVRRRRT